MRKSGERFKAILKQKIEDFKSANNKVVKVGIIENQHYDNETPVAYVASVHEYGCEEKNIKPRPFFRPTIGTKRKDWSETLRIQLKNGLSIAQALDSVGYDASGDVVKTISEIHTPPLALSTKIARNRKAHRPYANGRKRRPKSISIKPLIDTGLLIESISHQIVDKGD